MTANIIASIALIISIYTYFMTISREKSRDYYDDFFKEFHRTLIPNAIKSIQYDSGKFIDKIDFSNTIAIEFKNAIYSLKFLDIKLYEESLDQMNKIEDLFVMNHEKSMSSDLFEGKIENIEKEVAFLYKKTKRK